MWNRFNEYDAILIPSRELEAFSLTAIEAQAHGLPVIYGNGGGIVDVVGQSGVLIHDNKPKTLAKIIDKIAEDPSTLKEYRDLGLKNAKNYTIDRQIQKIINLTKKYAKRTKYERSN